MVPCACRPGNSHLTYQQVVLPDAAVMTDYNAVAELGSLTNYRAFHGSSLNNRIAAHFHIIFEHDISNLRNFIMNPLVRGKAVAITTHHSAGLQNHAIPQHALVINHRRRINNTILTNLRTRHDGNMWIYVCIIADLGVFPDHREGMNVDTLSDPCGFRDHCQRRNASCRVSPKTVQ